MFERLDVDTVDGDVEKLAAADVKEVVVATCTVEYNAPAIGRAAMRVLAQDLA